MTSRGTSLLRTALGVQAAVTAAPVVRDGTLSLSAFVVLVLAAAAVFVACLDELRGPALVFEAGAGLVAVLLLLAGVVVPGTVVGLGVSWLLLSSRGRVLLEGRPAVALEVPGAPVGPRPVVVAPVQVPGPRVATVDVLPRRR